MEAWIPLALLAPLLFAGCNFVDKYLIEKVTEDSPAYVITILAGLAGVPFLIFVGFIARNDITSFGIANALGAISAGLLVLWGYYFYYKALVIADASLVAILFQMIVVFNYVLALIFLGEHLSVLQLAAMGLIIGGSIILTVESENRSLKFNKDIFVKMLIACFLIAVSDVVFKKIAKETAYLPTQFYEYSAGVIAGIFLLVFHSKARNAFIAMAKKFKRTAIGASTFNEVLNLGGIISMRYAMFLAPIAVVQAVMSVQSIYLILLGLLLSRLLPKYIHEDVNKKHLTQKILAVAIMIIGTIIVATNS